MMPEYTLYYAPDNASQIIRLALEELSVAYECQLVDRAVAAQKEPPYLAINPAGKIPALKTPDGIVTETGAILLYLAERHGRLAPRPGAQERAQFLRWLFFIANTLHPDLAMSFYMDRYTSDADAARTRSAERLKNHLAIIDAAAQRGEIPALGGSEPGVLDFYMCCLLRWSALYPMGKTGWFNLADYPALLAVTQRIEERPCTQCVSEAEGLGATPFSNPDYANPPEGVAL